MSNAMAQKVDDRRNMTPFDEVVFEIDELYDEAKNWADGAAIESQEQCDALDALDKALLAADKKREAIRKDEARPFDDGKAAVQAKHNPVKDKVARARDVLNKPRSVWKAKIEAEKRARAEQAAREAEVERQKAIEAMRASAGDLEAREEAERQLELAKEAEAFAKREDKRANTGNGLRTYWVATMPDPREAVRSMWAQNPQAFIDLAQELADKAVRSGTREIAGFEITEQKKAI